MTETISKIKQPTEQTNTLLEDIIEHTATVVHVLTIGVTLFVIYLCFQDNSFSLTTWHVFLYTIGWFFLVTEGILYLTKENILSKRGSARWRVHVHWIVIIIGIGFSIGGFLTIYYNKRSHFTSVHGITGLVSGILGCLACINGIPTLFSGSLRKKIPPNWNKLFHSFIGFSAVILGSYAMITGYYIRWFTGKTSDTAVITCFVVTVLITVWALLKPLINMFVRIKNIFS